MFAATTGKIAFLGERLFRTTISFPANVPTGAYLVEIFLVRDKDVIGAQTTPLVVSKVGVDAAVFYSDITSAKKTEEREAASARQVRQIFEAIPDGVVIVDRDWRFSFANQRALVPPLRAR